jgi:hypothetical protein
LGAPLKRRKIDLHLLLCLGVSSHLRHTCSRSCNEPLG